MVFDELKKKAEESIYTWEPKYDIHRETFTVDSEATEVNDSGEEYLDFSTTCLG